MKKSRLILRAVAAFMAIALMWVSGAALAASIPARINSSAAKVYNVPSTSSKVYVQGGKGVVVSVTGYSNGWARVLYKGNTGYTPISNLNLVNRPKGYTIKSTPVYRQSSTSSTRMGTLSAGSTVYVVGVSGNFYRVQNASGSVTGYVQKGTLATKSAMTTAYKKYLAYMAALAASSGSSSGGSSSGSSSSGSSSSGGSSSGSTSSTGTVLSPVDKVIALATALIGKPYAASANPPSSFNCSVYVKYCFEYAGYDMENTALKQSQDSSYTLITDINKIQRGDILCFYTDNDAKICDHTAIYIGNNQFLEASQAQKVVQKNDLDDWYRSRFLCARRVF